MQSSTAAGRYAKALFALAKEDRRVAETRTEMAELGGLLDDNAALHEAMLTPLHPADERKAVLDAIADRLELSPLMRKFYSFLIDQRRLVDFEGIAAEYDRLADEEAGLLTAHVVSASPLDERRRDRLRRALSERTGREVRVEVEVDPSLVGGAIAKVGDLVFDGSIRTQLGQLRNSLLGDSAER